MSAVVSMANNEQRMRKFTSQWHVKTICTAKTTIDLAKCNEFPETEIENFSPER